MDGLVIALLAIFTYAASWLSNFLAIYPEVRRRVRSVYGFDDDTNIVAAALGAVWFLIPIYIAYPHAVKMIKNLIEGES